MSMNTIAPHLRRTATFAPRSRVVRLSGRRRSSFRGQPTAGPSGLARYVRGRFDDLPGTERNASPSDLALRPFGDVHSLHR